MGTMVGPLEIELLSGEQCARVAGAVDSLRPLWIDRGRRLFTLGVAAYLDAPHPFNVDRSNLESDSDRDYCEPARRLNPELLKHFDWLYESIRAALADALGEGTTFLTDKALPGFHIFESDPSHEDVASHYAHVDRPYAGLDWREFEQPDFDRSISYTLPIEIPSAGAGLRIWDVDLSHAGEWPPDVVRQRLREAGSTVHAYAPGRLLLHSGHALHRIEPWKYVEGERRLTLQGHGLYCDGGWRLYF